MSPDDMRKEFPYLRNQDDASVDFARFQFIESLKIIVRINQPDLVINGDQKGVESVLRTAVEQDSSGRKDKNTVTHRSLQACYWLSNRWSYA
jgi:hypothetical protein